jgi:hypothetical protein
LKFRFAILLILNRYSFFNLKFCDVKEIISATKIDTRNYENH